MIRLQPVLDLLDEGLRIYRRGFLSFVLIAAIWFVPLAIALGLAGAAFAWLSVDLGVLLFMAVFLISLPLAFYLMGAMSRATLMIHQDQTVHLRTALQIPPRRVAAMGCFGVIFTLVGSTVTSLVGCICFAPIFTIMGIGLGTLFASAPSANGPLGMVVVMLYGTLFLVAYAILIMVSSSVYSAMIYAIQPFAQEQLGFGAAVERSITLLRYRLRNNLLAFAASSLLFYAVAFSAYTAVSVLLPLPLRYLFGVNSTLVGLLTAAIVILGMVVALPPLPIWMALLYEQNVAAYEGTDLAERISAL